MRRGEAVMSSAPGCRGWSPGAGGGRGGPGISAVPSVRVAPGTEGTFRHEGRVGNPQVCAPRFGQWGPPRVRLLAVSRRAEGGGAGLRPAGAVPAGNRSPGGGFGVLPRVDGGRGFGGAPRCGRVVVIAAFQAVMAALFRQAYFPVAPSVPVLSGFEREFRAGRRACRSRLRFPLLDPSLRAGWSWGSLVAGVGADGGDGGRGVGGIEGCDFDGVGVVEAEFDDVRIY